MTDVISPERRSALMSRIRGSNTGPEIVVRWGLHRAGYRFRLHRRELPGCPDLVLTKYRAVIFVHGCFWHRHRGCKLAYRPKSRTEFWTEKFRKNQLRDRKQQRELLDSGWRVLVVWECAVRRDVDRAKSVQRIEQWLRSGSILRQIGSGG
jgi:DNA mismatch endonuclease, patch repair protein